MLKLFVVFIVSLATILFQGVGSCSGQDISRIDFSEKIRPLLEQYCFECHAPGKMNGLDFLSAENGSDVAELRGLFASVVEQIENQQMPPKNFDQPTDEERELVVDWIKTSLDLTPADTDRISQYVVEAYEDRKGSLWFGTMHDGAARYDGNTLTYFSEKDGLPSNTVSSFAEDKEGNLWMGTHDGVCKYNGETFTQFGNAEGLPVAASQTHMASAGVQADREGNIWVSMGSSLFRYDGKSFVEFEIPIAQEAITSYAITAGNVSLDLEDSNGNQWFGTDGNGAYKFDGKSFTHYTTMDGLCSNNITGIMEDQQGNIWFTCMQSYQPKMTGDGGVCRYDGTTFTQFPDIKGLSENDIYTIYETRAGSIWIGASGVGAYRYDGKTFTLFNETDRQHWTRNFGVQSIVEDRNGTLWFGFSGGLFRFNGNSFFNVTKEGPWTDLVSAMAESASGSEEEMNWFHADTQAAMSALAGGQFDQARMILLKLKSEEPNEPTIQEEMINRVGYQLVFSDHVDLAIELFKINTHLYPQASNTFDSLAEAYLRSGEEQLAVNNYEKSFELNPENSTAKEALSKISARRKYESALVAPNDWLEEVLVVPPNFAPTMSLKGMEHLRLPPEFRDPDSDWFISYLFAIELTEPAELNEEMIGEQLLLYFRGLASGGADQNGKMIETDKFSIEPQKLDTEQAVGEYVYTLTWQEPFANATTLKQNLRVKVISGKNKHGVVFICGSPQPFGSTVWTELLEIRTAFESAPVPVESVPVESVPAETLPTEIEQTTDNFSAPPEHLKIIREKEKATGYGAGDVVADGLLDRAGNLWFVTSNEGVYRFDGHSFVNFSEDDGLNSNAVWSVMEDKDGILWFGTADGLCKYDGQTFTHVPIPGGDDDSKLVLSLLEDRQGNIWIGTCGSGAYRFDGETFTSFLKNEGRIQPDGRHCNVIQSMTEDSDGNIWFTSQTHGGVSRYDGQNLTHFTMRDGLSDDMIFSSFQDSSGNMWFGTRDNGLCRFDGESFTNFNEADGLRSRNVSCFHEDRTGKLWLGSFARSGVCCFDGTTFTNFPDEGGPDLIDTRFIIEDKDENLWFGGRFGLLWRYDGTTLTDFTTNKR